MSSSSALLIKEDMHYDFRDMHYDNESGVLEGIVGLSYQGLYGYICDDDIFDHDAAQVVCTQMGFKHGSNEQNVYGGCVQERHRVHWVCA